MGPKHEVFKDGELVESREFTPEEIEQRNYRLREGSYPPIGDQLDALWKALEGSPIAEHPEAKSMLSRIQEVKTRYPKAGA